MDDIKDDKSSVGCGCLIIIICLFLISSCVGGGSDDSITESFEVSTVDIRTAVQLGVESNEMISGVKWPRFTEDYNISEIGDKTYRSRGEFTHDGSRYNFAITVRFNDNDTYSVLDCTVSR